VQNWDERSGLRMRIRSWAAFFAEGTLAFWNTSFAKDYRAEAANIYRGPEERGYMKVLRDFTIGFDPRATITSIDVSHPSPVRGYALRGPAGYAAYLHAYTDHAQPTVGARVTIDPLAAGTAIWSSPATGRLLGKQPVGAGRQTLDVPPFVTDVALKITGSPPSSTKD
jgi:hypothetical protein